MPEMTELEYLEHFKHAGIIKELLGKGRRSLARFFGTGGARSAAERKALQQEAAAAVELPAPAIQKAQAEKQFQAMRAEVARMGGVEVGATAPVRVVGPRISKKHVVGPQISTLKPGVSPKKTKPMVTPSRAFVGGAAAIPVGEHLLFRQKEQPSLKISLGSMFLEELGLEKFSAKIYKPRPAPTSEGVRTGVYASGKGSNPGATTGELKKTEGGRGVAIRKKVQEAKVAAVYDPVRSSPMAAFPPDWQRAAGKARVAGATGLEGAQKAMGSIESILKSRDIAREAGVAEDVLSRVARGGVVDPSDIMAARRGIGSKIMGLIKTYPKIGLVGLVAAGLAGVKGFEAIQLANVKKQILDDLAAQGADSKNLNRAERAWSVLVDVAPDFAKNPVIAKNQVLQMMDQDYEIAWPEQARKLITIQKEIRGIPPTGGAAAQAAKAIGGLI